jgi:phospholipase C
MPPGPINKVVIIFLENHTLDDAASDVAGVDGDLSLPPAPDLVSPDPPHDHAHWMRRNDPAPGGALRQRYGRQQLPRLYRLMDTFTDAQSGGLPDVSWVYAPRGQDFHPGSLSGGGSRMSASDAWLGSAVDALAVVVSRYAKSRYVSHVRSSHLSLVAFVERLFGLPPSPSADAARRTSALDEHAMEDCLATGQPPLPAPV